MFVYDYKYPSLTFDVYNMLLQNIEYYDRLGQKRPMFCVVNFKDPRYSLRCNPLNPQYITSLTDCTEIADVIMKNLVETDKKDFFTQSAQLYIEAHRLACGVLEIDHTEHPRRAGTAPSRILSS